jgi:5-methylcytosine-specific restriction protein A
VVHFVPMPTASPHPCMFPGCSVLIRARVGAWCEKHAPRTSVKSQHYDSQRGTAAERGYTYAWRAARMQYLLRHPLCIECERDGRVRAATEVDHIMPHNGNAGLFWSENNWQSLCKSHHSAKTRREQFAKLASVQAKQASVAANNDVRGRSNYEIG